MKSGLTILLSPESFILNEPMKKHTTFKIGGPADILVRPRSIEELKITAEYCKQQQVPLFIMGLGSNILVGDKGIRGVVVKLGNSLKKCQVNGEEINAQAGIRLSELARIAAANSLSGLEFAEGIPGSLGGAVVMNAGAYDGEMKDVIVEVEAINPQGEYKKFSAADVGFSYRHSNFQSNEWIVTAARMQLKTGESAEIKRIMQEHARNRREKQPLEYPSAGSVFKRPPGYYVGPMIEKLGLKGFRIGGAEVSIKHAGFIVNRGNATAQDVLELIDLIKEKVQEQFAVELQTEIRAIGEF